MAVELLGHKRFLAEWIVAHIEEVTEGVPCDVLDLFCGSGAVSSALRAKGYSVTANDHLTWCATFAEAILLNPVEPLFAGILEELGGTDGELFEGSVYKRVIATLNRLPPRNGFVFRSYSPAAEGFGGGKRMYFTEENGGRIDAVRSKIAEWEGRLSRGEQALLLADLIVAANAVSNIAGTYGCYLKSWKSRALRRLVLQASRVPPGPIGEAVHCADAAELASRCPARIIYADPPYTKRQYAAYYHVLETIALGDEPAISGSTGLRDWRDKSSDFCYRKKAPAALKKLLAAAMCEHLFLSYNEDGQIPHDEILELLGEWGDITVWEQPYRRYKSSLRPHKGRQLVERLYHLRYRG
jgi:adenine-specific DNA-methyltransferase